MANYHGLWENGDTGRGRAALDKASELAYSPESNFSARKSLYRCAG